MRSQRTEQNQFEIKLEEQTNQLKNELSRQIELVRKAENKIDHAKTNEKSDLVQSMQKIKKLEVQVRELKAKAQQAENMQQKKDQQLVLLKAADEKRQAAEVAYTIRDNQTFQNHFGHKARPSEEKYVIFLRMYENQAEKMRKEIQNLQMYKSGAPEQQQENAAAAGSIGGGGQGHDQINLEKIRDLQEINIALKRNLQENSNDFKDLLKQLELLRKDVQGKDDQIHNLQNEVRSRPNLAQLNSKQF